jgi:hypothetical protein
MAGRNVRDDGTVSSSHREAVVATTSACLDMALVARPW